MTNKCIIWSKKYELVKNHKKTLKIEHAFLIKRFNGL